MTTAKPVLLLMHALVPGMRAPLEAIAEVVDGTGPDGFDHAEREAGPRIEAILTIGTIGLTAAQMDRLPALRIVSCMGVGYEGVDVAAAQARGITVTNGHGTNAETVADHALGLILAVVRAVPEFDASVRGGEWRTAAPARPDLNGMRLGIVGLGSIGAAIARRCEGGFGMGVAYHNRRPRPELPYRYIGGVRDLAAASDVLVLAAPGGAGTRHIVDAGVLEALGADGFLVNIARGSLVDTQALIGALQTGTVAGAALDVVDGEPVVPPALLACPNLVVTPHVAGRSPASQRAMLAHAVANFVAFFAGRPVSTPVSA